MVNIAQCHTQLFTDEVNLQIDLQNVHFMKNIIVIIFINMLYCLLSIHFLQYHYHYHYGSQF